jgi:adenylate cyclase
LELLEPPGESEQDLLELLGAKPRHRLACQARVRPGQGLIRLRAIAAGPPVGPR